MAQLFPQIATPHREVIREMVFQELLRRSEVGATPAELAADLIKGGKAKGTREGCAALLTPLLEELVEGLRAKRDGERFVAFGVTS